MANAKKKKAEPVAPTAQEMAVARSIFEGARPLGLSEELRAVHERLVEEDRLDGLLSAIGHPLG